MNHYRQAALAALLALSPVVALAQAPQLATGPEQTTANFGDWMLRCVRAAEGTSAKQMCEVVQALSVQSQQQPIARVAVGSPDGKADNMRLTLMIAPSIALTEAPQLQIRNKGGAPVSLTWRRCLPTGCFADAVLNRDQMKELRDRVEPMELTLKDAGNQQAALVLSPKGLSQALDAMAKETGMPPAK